MKATKAMKVQRFFMSCLAIVFPWLVLLLYDNPGGALVALVLQATAIGWLPATIWAWRVVHESPTENKGEVDKVGE